MEQEIKKNMVNDKEKMRELKMNEMKKEEKQERIEIMKDNSEEREEERGELKVIEKDVFERKIKEEKRMMKVRMGRKI